MVGSSSRVEGQSSERESNSIAYAACALGPKILVESDSGGSNHGLLVIGLLDRLSSEPREEGEQRPFFRTYSSISETGITLEAHVFLNKGIYTACVVERRSPVGREVAYQFLRDISESFLKHIGNPEVDIPAYHYDHSFGPTLSEFLKKYNAESMASHGVMGRVRTNMKDIEAIVVENIDLMLERGENLQSLVEKTDRLDHNAFVFKKGSSQMRRSMWWKEKRSVVLVCIVVLLLLYCFAASLCGLSLHC